MSLTTLEWTIIARSSVPGHWHWTGGHTPDAARKDSDANKIIMMHRRTPHGWELVARLTGPAWRRWQAKPGLKR